MPIEQVVEVMLEKHDVVRGILHGHSWDASPGLSSAERLAQQAAAIEFLLADRERHDRFMDQALALLKAFALAGAHETAMAIRDDVRFFADVRAYLAKTARQGSSDGRGREGSLATETAIAQLISSSVSGDGIIDVFAEAGLDKPELSILSDEFLESLAAADRPNLQLELLRRLLADQIRTIRRENVVQSRRFSDLLDAAINRYQNRALTTAQVIAELVALAKELRATHDREAALGLSLAEVAFYDAVVQNDAAVLQLGDDTLKKIAQGLVRAVQESATIDWNLKESVRAAMRSKVRRLLAQYDYPPDKEDRAVDLVLEQAELFAQDVA